MPMLKSDFGRNWVLTVSRSGHVFVHRRGAKPEEGTLPVFTTDTEDQARELLVRHCRHANDGSDLYQLTHWEEPDEFDASSDLGDVADLFRASYDRRGKAPFVMPGMVGKTLAERQEAARRLGQHRRRVNRAQTLAEPVSTFEDFEAEQRDHERRRIR